MRRRAGLGWVRGGFLLRRRGRARAPARASPEAVGKGGLDAGSVSGAVRREVEVGAVGRVVGEWVRVDIVDQSPSVADETSRRDRGFRPRGKRGRGAAGVCGCR